MARTIKKRFDDASKVAVGTKTETKESKNQDLDQAYWEYASERGMISLSEFVRNKRARTFDY